MEWTLLKCGQDHSIKEARKLRDKLEKRDKKWFGFLNFLQVLFIIILLIVMVLVFKYIGEHVYIIKK